MTEAEITSRLTELMREAFGDDRVAAVRSLRPLDIDAWDSVNHLKLMIETETAFDVSFAAAEIGRLKNVGELLDLIRSKLSRKAA
jgi:acyl carrier protein